MHVVIADQLSSSAVEILRTVPGFTVDARPGRPAAELAKDLADADALVVRSATQVDAKLIAAAPRLRVIARAGTGVDNVTRHRFYQGHNLQQRVFFADLKWSY